MNQTVRVTLISTLVLVACSSSTSSTTTAIGCLEPPAEQVVETGVLWMEILPNRAASGTVVELFTDEVRLPETPIVGVGLDLQCWTEAGWTNLHRLTRDSIGEPTAIRYGTGATFAEPDLGVQLPNLSRVLVPDLAPGIYRISDAALLAGREFPGFAYLEVVAP